MVETPTLQKKNTSLTNSSGFQPSRNSSEHDSTEFTSPIAGPKQKTLKNEIVSIRSSVDVIVIGAGPAGLTLACELARRGVNFLIFDKSPDGSIRANSKSESSRALLLYPRTLEIFSDIGIVRSIVTSGKVLRGVEVIREFKNVSSAKFSERTSFPFTVAIDQDATEHYLNERLKAYGQKVLRPFEIVKIEAPQPVVAGNTVGQPEDVSVFAYNSKLPGTDSTLFQSSQFLQNTTQFRTFTSTADDVISNVVYPQSDELKKFDDGGKGDFSLSRDALFNFQTTLLLDQIQDQSYVVSIKTVPTSIQPATIEQVRCHYIVGCDGFQSCVRKTAPSISLENCTSSFEFLFADIMVSWGLKLHSERLTIVQSSKGVVLVIPMTENRWRIMCMQKSVTQTEPSKTFIGQEDPIYFPVEDVEFVELQEILETLIPKTILHKILSIWSFSIQGKLANAFRERSLLLCGDAAHIFLPIFSQGLNAGIQDAFNLGWKLAAVIKGSPVKLLSTYDTERRYAAQELTKATLLTLDTIIKSENAAKRCVAILMASVVASPADFFITALLRMMSISDLCYPPNPIISQNFLGRQALCTGMRIRDASVVLVPLTNEYSPMASEVPAALITCFEGGQHTLMLAVHVLPPGTKARTIFGCERNEEAERWNIVCLERLAKLGRLLSETFRGKNNEISWGGLKIIWVICGLVDFKNPVNIVGIGRIKDHVPHRLKYFFFCGAKLGARSILAIDYEGEVHEKYGFRLADPDSFSGETKSGAFILVRPDHHICCNGYAGDSKAVSVAFDYALTWYAG